MKFELKKVHRNTPIDELIADLKNTAKKLNQDFVTREQQDEFGKFDSSNIADRLGGWAKAHERAGLNLARHQKSVRLSDDELFQNLEEVWTKLGHQPIQADMFPPLSKYSAGVYKKHFGTWMKGLEIFVTNINNEEDISTEKSITNLQVETSTKHKTKREINWRLRFIVMRRDNFKCKNCGRSPATDLSIILHVDHFKAWAKGGETVLENLQTLCSVCNIGKSDLE
ncbi:MAG: HNH endonuclease [Candidatus Magasanikbacteria bacterium]|nr:HNH endonuclease [Candidatus Magasanikbacteria bacterium]